MIRPKKHLGQHFLHDENIARKIIGYLPDKAINILEIGPGTGILTKYLLDNKNFTSFFLEIDPESVRFLNQTFPEIADKLIHADVLHYDLSQIPAPFTIIGNFPYNISTQILFKVIEYRKVIPEVIGMFQKEVAERLVAEPGGSEYSRLTVAAALRAEIRIQGIYPPDSFYPPPGVESAVVSLKRRKRADIADEDWIWLDDTLKALFSQRKRKLRKALDTYSKLKRLAPGVALANINEGLLGKRVFELEPSDFLYLSRILKSAPGNSLSSSNQEYGSEVN